MLTVIACTSLLAGVAQAQTPQLVNGSFESPAVSTTTFNTTPPGWQNITTFGNFPGPMLVPNSDSSARDTTFGNQRMVIGGDGVAIQQTVAGFIAGQVYAFGFYAATEVLFPFYPAGDLYVQLLGAANQGMFFLFPPPATGPNNTVPFNYYEIRFVPQVNGAITFRLGNPNDILGRSTVTVDNVSVSLVPESGSTGFLLTAICSALVFARILFLPRRPVAV